MKESIFSKKYSSKVILFGEYTVLHGSKALAIPFDKYAGKWIYDKSHSSIGEIRKLKSYLLTKYVEGLFQYIDFDELEYQLTKGVAFESNIPQGYGVGSSGSVTAAIFDAFRKTDDFLTISELKQELALIESCYHGSSSGIDPLVSFLHQPILIHNKKKVELLDATNTAIIKDLFLVDTQIKRSTAPLVNAYLEMRRSSASFIMDVQMIAELNDNLIEAYMLNKGEDFQEMIKTLSKHQFRVLNMLIPQPFQEAWKRGLETGNYSMKLNGAGGGGFLMLYRHNKEDNSDVNLIPLYQKR